MAIEGALLRETVASPNTECRWIDGLQNIADILTKPNADKEFFRRVMREARFTLQQDEVCRLIKEKKQQQNRNRFSGYEKNCAALRNGSSAVYYFDLFVNDFSMVLNDS